MAAEPRKLPSAGEEMARRDARKLHVYQRGDHAQPGFPHAPRAEPAAAVEIVVNGPAVAAALASPHDTDRLLRVCANTLANNDLEADPQLARVKAAVLYIAQRQRDGWAYMRA